MVQLGPNKTSRSTNLKIAHAPIKSLAILVSLPKFEEQGAPHRHDESKCDCACVVKQIPKTSKEGRGEEVTREENKREIESVCKGECVFLRM